MAPAKKTKANTVKRGRQVIKSENIDAPPAKKRLLDNQGTQQPSRATSVSSLTSSQPRRTEVVDLEDEESVQQYIKPKPKPKPKTITRMKKMAKPEGKFPTFWDGDVIIELVPGNPKFSFQLHGSVLQRASPWFKKAMRPEMAETELSPLPTASAIILGKMWARFELEYCPKLEAYVLARKKFTCIEECEQDLPALKKHREAPIEIEDDLNEETQLDSSQQRQKPTDSFQVVDDVDEPVSDGSAGRAGKNTLPENRAGPGEEDNFAEAASNILDADTVSQLQLANEDSMVADNGSVVLEATELADDDSGQTEESSAPVTAPQVEEEEELDVDVSMGHDSDESDAGSSGGIKKEESPSIPMWALGDGLENEVLMPDYAQPDCDDSDGNSSILEISQADGPSGKKTSNGRKSTQPTTGSRPSRCSTENSHCELPVSAVVGKSSKGLNTSVSGNSDEVSVTALAIQESKSTSDHPEEATIKEEMSPAVPTLQSSKGKTSSIVETNKPSAEILLAYHNLFLICYSRPPIINTQDIGVALEQSELLINVARLYGSIPLTRPYLKSALMHFGRGLYLAIMADPPRWIHLSVYLESAPIFQEGIVHVVANYPYWPWPSLKLDELFDTVFELIEQKIDAFLRLKTAVNKSLFTNAVREVEVFLRPLDKDGFDTWFVVQYWRDWFAKSLAKANTASEASQKCTHGKVYRELLKGGEAYLPTILVLDAVQACRSKDLFTKSQRQGIEQDLKTLKDFAQEEVQRLCANYSMLAVEEAGIEYLTCIKVENDEFPWVKLKII